jgi:hypothetical protein
MLVTEITTHVEDALARFLQQYQGTILLNGLMAALVEQIQDLEYGLYPLDAARQIFNAQGAQLDGIGALVGISRNGLSDAEYLLFIYGQIASNFSDGTIPQVLNIIQSLFQAQSLIFQEVFPAGVSVQVLGTPLNPSLYGVAINLVKNSLGAGINLVFIGGSPTVNVFRFNGPGIVGAVNGFGDINNPSIGGGFVGII